MRNLSLKLRLGLNVNEKSKSCASFPRCFRAAKPKLNSIETLHTADCLSAELIAGESCGQSSIYSLLLSLFACFDVL